MNEEDPAHTMAARAAALKTSGYGVPWKVGGQPQFRFLAPFIAPGAGSHSTLLPPHVTSTPAPDSWRREADVAEAVETQRRALQSGGSPDPRLHSALDAWLDALCRDLADAARDDAAAAQMWQMRHTEIRTLIRLRYSPKAAAAAEAACSSNNRAAAFRAVASAGRPVSRQNDSPNRDDHD
jgi:hypothetical protein